MFRYRFSQSKYKYNFHEFGRLDAYRTETVQLLAPLIIGVIEVSGKISNPINRTQNILYKNISIIFNFLR